MAIMLIALALLTGGFATLYLWAPGVVVRLSRVGNRPVATDEVTLVHRHLTAALLLLACALFVYVAVRL